MDGVIGYVTPFAGTFAPRGWALCNGQSLPLSQNTPLYAIIGLTYGGNGSSQFNLPNLQGRAIVGAGQGTGLSSYSLGQTGGAETATMNMEQMPAHAHPVEVTITPAANGTANASSPSGGVYATGSNSLYNYSGSTPLQTYPSKLATGPVGASTPISTLQPVLAINYVICVQGTFPSRN